MGFPRVAPVPRATSGPPARRRQRRWREPAPRPLVEGAKGPGDGATTTTMEPKKLMDPTEPG